MVKSTCISKRFTTIHLGIKCIKCINGFKKVYSGRFLIIDTKALRKK